MLDISLQLEDVLLYVNFLNTKKHVNARGKPFLSEQTTRLAHMIWSLLLQLLDFGHE